LLDIRAGCYERDEATQIASAFSNAISSIITNYNGEIRQLHKVFSISGPLVVASMVPVNSLDDKHAKDRPPFSTTLAASGSSDYDSLEDDEHAKDRPPFSTSLAASGSSDYGSLEDEQTKVSIQGTEELRQVERIIRSHKSVEGAVAVWNHAEDSQRAHVVAFVTLRALGAERQIDPLTQSGDGDNDEALRVQFWDAYWEGCTYTAMDNLEAKAIGRDFLGWTSTYNGKEIDKAEMNEWLDETIKTIVDGGSPTHILEIGTGSGMILFNLINDERSYVGLEMSKTAVEFVTKMAKSMPTVADRIHIYQATASDLDSLDIPTSPELVVINSVAQYFPTQNYLLQVLESILRLQTVRTIFFGDIRSHCLYAEFLVSKVLYEGGENPTKEELRASMTATAQRELELLIDPAFFTALPSLFPGLVEHVEILPKKVKASNELSCYRYAAVVHVKPPGQPSRRQELREVGNTEWVDFTQHGLGRERLLRRLENSKGVVAVSNIPNSKTAFETLVVGSIRRGAENGVSRNADWLASVRQDAQNQSSLSALDLAGLAQQAGYRVELSWARQYSQRGGIDAIFHHYQPCDGQSRVMFRFPTDHEGRESRTLSNHPMQLQAEQEIQEELDDLLEAELPVHMLPKQIHIVENLPMNRKGEVDCHALMGNCESELIL
jgi:SAM-dependent methyltransferase